MSRADSSGCSRRSLLARGGAAAAGVLAARGKGLAASAPPAVTALDPALDGWVEQHRARYGIPGLSVVVVRDGAIIHSRGYGAASLEFDLPSTPDSVYQLASVTKVFAAVATMRLVDRGKVDLEAPVTALLPGAPAAWAQVRVHHLLDHTSGLPAHAGANPRYLEELEKRKRRDAFADADALDYFTPQERLQYLAELPLAFEPGTQHAYNQTGFILLGMLIERLGGSPFPALVAQEIFRPLGMATACFGDSRVVVRGRPAGAYSRQHGNQLQNWLWPYAPSDYPAAGLNASAVDVAKFFQALDGDSLLSQQSRTRMWQPAALRDGQVVRYGLGWSVYELSGMRAVGHEGGGCCWVVHMPSQRLSVIALSNLAGARADETADEIAKRYLGRASP
jgi:CubicO group peptidase (beta-lactamase class C family)